jgi:hypothetical protein
MNRRTALSLVAASLLGTGCQVLSSDLVEVLPDDRIQISLPIAWDAKDAGTRDWAVFYLMTAEVTEDVNGFVGSVLGTLTTITSYPPSSVDESGLTATWGPWGKGLDPVSTRLDVTHDTTEGDYLWTLLEWPRDGEESSATSVVDGQIDAGATHEASTGRFTVDFTAMNAMDPTVNATGIFDVDYDIGPDEVSGTATFTDFSAGMQDASYAYDQSAAGDGVMDLAVNVDVNANGVMEILYIRSRWLASGAGRSDVYVTAGDFGEAVHTASECWDTSFERSYFVASYSTVVEGDLATCVFADADYTEIEL